MGKPTGRTFVYSCGEDSSQVSTVTVKVDTADAWLFLPDTTVHLEPVVSASGARFQSGSYLYWSKGGEATVEVAGRIYNNCQIDREEATWQEARLRGVIFRATGNEPGWYMEIKEDSIKYVLDYGESTFYTPSPGPAVKSDGASTVYETETDSLAVKIMIFKKTCTSMSGKKFSASVELHVDGKIYHGCGMAFQQEN